MSSGRYQYTGIDRLFAKLDREIGPGWSEIDVVEQAGEALEAIQCVKSYEESVIFLEVKNHQAMLPKGLHAIIQVARNTRWDGYSVCTVDCITPVIAESGCDISKLCPPEKTIIYEDRDGGRMSYTSRYTFDIAFKIMANTATYTREWVPVTLSDHTFFNSLVCELPCGVTPIYDTCGDEYTVVAEKALRFSFSDGLIALSYLKQVVDKETGYPMVPDTFSHLQALTWYIKLKRAERDYETGREGAKGRMDKAEAQWQWYCKQASNIDMMPYGVDDHQKLLNQNSYMIPRRLNYYGFFGNLSKPEIRTYNNR